MENNESHSTEAGAESTGPGAQLKAKREAAGHALETVAKDTRIPRAKLTALEEDDYARVGASAFVAGYIRAYAKWLGINADPLVSAYEQACRPEPGHYQNFVHETVEREPGRQVPAKRLPLIRLTLVLLVLWVIAALVLNGNKSADNQEAPVIAPQEPVAPESEPATAAPTADFQEGESEGGPEPADEEMPAEADQPTEPASLENAAADSTAEAAAPDTLNLDFTGDCWVEIRDANGEVLFAQLQQAGDNLQLSGQAPFSVMLGNARVATLAVNGRAVNTNPGPNRDTLRLRVGP